MIYDIYSISEIMEKTTKTLVKESLNNNLVQEWTTKITETLTAYYGTARNHAHLEKIIMPVVKKAVEARSFNSFNEFLGTHNPEYHETNKNGNLRNVWWGTLAYLLKVTDKLEKDGVDEGFMTDVIRLMDYAIETNV